MYVCFNKYLIPWMFICNHWLHTVLTGQSSDSKK